MKRVLVAVGALVLLGGLGLAVALKFHVFHVGGVHMFSSEPRPVLVAVPVITTNLDGSSSNFAEVAFTVQLRGAADATLFSNRQAAVLDAVIADLRTASLGQLDGARGMTYLGDKIQGSLDGVLGQRGAVMAVFFTQFVVQ